MRTEQAIAAILVVVLAALRLIIGSDFDNLALLAIVYAVITGLLATRMSVTSQSLSLDIGFPELLSRALRKKQDEIGGGYEVWFGTNRRPIDQKSPKKGFSAERDTRTYFGMCKVYIPKSHKIGSLGSSWFRRMLTRRDDRLKLRATRVTKQDVFWEQLRRRMSSTSLEDRALVVFIHGYNVSFGGAALRAAQIGYDLSVKGAMAFYSWPSQGTFGGYHSDEASIEASESQITDFLVGCAEKVAAKSVHIIAHSMGNRALIRAVNRIAISASTRSGRHFDQVILAAPDVDADVFRALAAAYSSVSRRTTLYISSKDRAIGASEWLHGYPRAGLMPPVMLVDGIDTIAVSNVDVTLLGHGYVGEARDLLQDMHRLINLDLPPERRFGVAAARTPEGQYWVLRA